MEHGESDLFPAHAGSVSAPGGCPPPSTTMAICFGIGGFDLTVRHT